MFSTWWRGKGGVLQLLRRGAERLTPLLLCDWETPYSEFVAYHYREILARDPSLNECQYWESQFNRRKLSPEQLPEALRCSSEYEDVVKPLLPVIEASYAKFLFRLPSREDVARHINHFRDKHPTFEACARAIKEGNIQPYLGIRPFYLEMDVTNQCNLRCIMCYFSDERFYKRKREDLSVEDFARIAEQLFPLCHQVSLSVGTEPLIHRRFGELLSITKKYEIPHVSMYTNGVLLNEALIDQMIQENLHQIVISIDAATKQTYERIRVGARFDKLISNIRAINRAKQRSGSNTPRIVFNFVLMHSNIRELPALIRLAVDLQVESVGTVHVVPYASTPGRDESLAQHKDLCNRMLDEARQLAEMHGIQVNLPKFAESPGPALPAEPATTQTRFESNRRYFDFLRDDELRSHCQFPWNFIALNSDGTIHPCGWWYNEQSLGNVKTESFEEIWNNDQYRALRSEHSSGALRTTCRTCPAAGMGNMHNDDAFLVKELTVLERH